ncbi:hypothetical protein MNBD_GAMMA03-451 [hydrothermal vent metagenome]|uniref:Uncharacterized protein n=1 Tax=hydrothermal vent metagenome TaxID=652676 RepID=A0A3B0WLH1_9ZZZZ
MKKSMISNSLALVAITLSLLNPVEAKSSEDKNTIEACAFLSEAILVTYGLRYSYLGITDESQLKDVDIQNIDKQQFFKDNIGTILMQGSVFRLYKEGVCQTRHNLDEHMIDVFDKAILVSKNIKKGLYSKCQLSIRFPFLLDHYKSWTTQEVKTDDILLGLRGSLNVYVHEGCGTISDYKKELKKMKFELMK